MIIRLLGHDFESYIEVLKKLPINIGQLDYEYFNWIYDTLFDNDKSFEDDLDQFIYWIEEVLLAEEYGKKVNILNTFETVYEDKIEIKKSMKKQKYDVTIHL